MPIIKVDNAYIDVDITGELEQYEWTRPRWTSDKLIAASPFRYDNTPSFFVGLDGEYAGVFHDSGAYDRDYESGGFAKLLAFLRDETYEESVDYLLSTYGVGDEVNSGKVSVPKVQLAKKVRKVVVEESVLKPYQFRHSYLGQRGISEKVQRFMDVGYSKDDKAVVMPWRHVDGTLANYKFRKIQGKSFWYRKGAAPIRTLVYGIDKVYRHSITEVYVCEAEIDAMSWWTSGKPAIAVGGTTLSDEQVDMIRRSPIERLVIAKDNDKAGDKLGRKLIEKLRGHVELYEVSVPTSYKDANDALKGGADLGGLIPKPVRLHSF